MIETYDATSGFGAPTKTRRPGCRTGRRLWGRLWSTTMSKTPRIVKKQTVTNSAAQPTSTTDTVIVTSPNVERDGSKNVVYLRARDTDAPKPRCRFADRDVKRESTEPRTSTQLITAGSLDSELAGPLVNCDPLRRRPAGCKQHRSATTRDPISSLGGERDD